MHDLELGGFVKSKCAGLLQGERSGDSAKRKRARREQFKRR